MQIKFALALLTACAAFAATAQQQQAAPSPQPIRAVGDARRGEAAADRWCVGCHLSEGKSTGTDAAPTFRWIAEQVQKDPNYIRTFLSHPHAPMPPLELSRFEIEDFVAYFQELSKR